jgi:methyl-accepting chemotaxis protein
MLNRLSIKAKLIGMSLLAVMMILGLTGLGVYSIRQGTSSLAEVYEHNVQPLILLQEMDSVLKEVRFRLVAVPLDQMSIKGSRDQLNEARERIPQIWAEFNTMMKGASLDAEEKETVANMDKEVASLGAFFRKLDGIYESNNKEALLAPLQEEWPLINRNLLKPWAQLIPAQDAEVKKIYESSVARGQKMIVFSLVVMSISMVLLLAITFLLIRGIIRSLATAQQVAATIAGGDLSSKIDASQKDEVGQLLLSMKNMNSSLAVIVGDVRNSTDSIATAAKEIAQGNAELSSRTEQQASSLEETASSMEQMSATVKQNAENAKLANQLAESASDIAIKGGIVVDKVVDTMASISESSKKIVDIISVIESIAFQTNILALNAAVEAARAGEHGRGFAVVAGEVRNLSQRSSTSAKDIKALIDDSVSKVNAGSKLVDQAGTTMTEVVTSIKRVTDIMSEISAASSEQSAGIDQVNQAITQMDDVTQQNAAQVEEAAAAAEAMEEQAEALQEAVSIFILDDSGASSQTAPPATARIPTLNTVAVASGRKTRKQLTINESNDNDWKEF